MTVARSQLVDVNVSPRYHVISKTVRRAWLLSEGQEDRKQWIEDRLRELSGVFAVEIAGFAVLDSHLHVLVRLCPDRVPTWSDEDVVRRWARVAVCGACVVSRRSEVRWGVMIRVLALGTVLSCMGCAEQAAKPPTAAADLAAVRHGAEPVATAAGEAGRTLLNIPLERQRTQVWCWAAVIKMTYSHFGILLPQEQIVIHTLGRAAEVPAEVHQIRSTLSFQGSIDSSYRPYPLKMDEVKVEIDSGRPIIAVYRDSFSGHVVLIYGYDDHDCLYVHDPNYGSVVVPHGTTFSYSGMMIWAETICGMVPHDG